MKQFLRLSIQSSSYLNILKNNLAKTLAIIMLAASFTLIQTQANAQTSTLTGHVADSTTKPLAGVTVSTDKSKKFATTDNDGNFSITVTSNDKNLLFSFVGMKSITQPIGSQSFIDIVMVNDVSGLSDVVVVGYGTQKKGSITSGYLNCYS